MRKEAVIVRNINALRETCALHRNNWMSATRTRSHPAKLWICGKSRPGSRPGPGKRQQPTLTLTVLCGSKRWSQVALLPSQGWQENGRCKAEGIVESSSWFLIATESKSWWQVWHPCGKAVGSSCMKLRKWDPSCSEDPKLLEGDSRATRHLQRTANG